MAIVGVTANRRIDDGVHRDWIRRRYIDALVDVAGLEVVILPTSVDGGDALSVLERLDGLVLTGDESNIDPAHYLEDALDEGPNAGRDRYRDRLAFRAIDVALKFGMPILGICRGLQELNVSFGGSLWQDLNSQGWARRHSEDLSLPRDEQYLPVHVVNLERDGLLHDIFGTPAVQVNSLHGQGIKQLGCGLYVEAMADDGLVEAVRVGEKSDFQVGIQWHPEWHAVTDPCSRALLCAFHAACERYSSRVRAPAGAGRCS